MAESAHDLMLRIASLRDRALTVEQQARLDAVNARNAAIQAMTGKPADGVCWGKQQKGKA
ncbi:MAG TPA: hypothetical protein VMT20_07280 [Terriglobia bacterium]|nr:hypothetical protein [Terriglobia bacterium]